MTTPIADFITNSNSPFVIFAHNEGAWGNNLTVRLTNWNAADNSFDIEVYQVVGGVKSFIQRYTVSRYEQLDGYGKQMYLEQRINNRSKYIKIADNTALDPSILPDHAVADEVFVTGDGNTTSFTGTVAQAPVVPGSIVFSSDIKDSGTGLLKGPGVSGQINYETGIWTLTYETAPANGLSITGSYDYVIEQALTGGSDGALPTTGQILEALDLLKDPDAIDFRILIGAGYTDKAIQDRMSAIANDRMDCMAILDYPEDILDPQDIVYWRQNDQGIDSSYAALYGPWVEVYDQYNDKQLFVPPSGFVAGVFAYTDTVADSHYPPAGLRRGLVRVLNVKRKYSDDKEYPMMYPKQINILKAIPGSGVVVWGQKTLQTKESALSRVNVRRLLIVVEKSVAAALRYVLFELNNDFTRLQVTQMITSFMRGVQARGGVTSFQVVCDETNNTPDVIDANELHVDVYLAPTRASEFIKLQTVITRTGASFQELIATGGNF